MVSYDLFRAIAHPCRREILSVLSGSEASSEASVAEILESVRGHFEMTRPALAKHLGILLRAGLLTERWRGREHVYKTAPGALHQVSGWVGEILEGRGECPRARGRRAGELVDRSRP